MFQTSYIELSASALRRNIRFLKDLIGPKVRFSSVIKGNAYGHGIGAFVPLAEKFGVRHFSVFSAHEALKALQARSQQSEIMIMGEIAREELEWAVDNGISFYIFDRDRLEGALTAARLLGRPARIHLEVETGLNRTGLQGDQLVGAVEMIRRNPGLLRVEGVCTHLAGAESQSNYLRIQKQIESYRNHCAWLEQQGVPLGLRHTACSAAAFTYPETIMEMARFGIAQYGFWPSKETKMHYFLNSVPQDQSRLHDPLKRVISWKSRIMNIKSVKPGEFVGYGTSYITTRPQRIASVPVGYFHGFSRSLSNLGHVLIQGRRASVVGLVNMNMMTIDVTDFPEVRKGEEVVIIGKQRKMMISVNSFSDLSRNITYEVLVRISSEIPRVVVG